MAKEEVRQRVEAAWRKVNDWLKKQEVTSINEEHTKALFVTPLLEALGWLENVNDIEFEYQIPKLKDRVDYALKGQNKAVALVEAKKLGEKLDDEKRKQLINYGNFTDVEVGILTNGIAFEVHDLTYKGEVGGGLVFAATLDVPEEGLPAQFDKLWLASKEAVLSGELTEYIKKTKALAGVRSALTERKSRLQQTMRSIMKRFLGRRASVEEVQTALRQALAQIETMAPVAKTAELTLPSEWQDEQLHDYLLSSRDKSPLEYAYYVALSKHEKMLSQEQLFTVLTEQMGRKINGKNIRGMLGGINKKIEQRMKRERLDKRESGKFGINPKYKDALKKYLV